MDESGKASDDARGRFDKLGGILKGIGVSMGSVAIAAGAAAIKIGKEVVQRFGALNRTLVDLKHYLKNTQLPYSATNTSN